MSFLMKKNFDTKTFYLYDLFFENQNFTTENVLIVKNSRFFQVSKFFGNPNKSTGRRSALLLTSWSYFCKVLSKLSYNVYCLTKF